MPKRWSLREKEVMRGLGLVPHVASGSAWQMKEDGSNDRVIAQLKSTDGKGINVQRQDVKDLMYHARMSRKAPIFVLDFVGDFLLVASLPSRLSLVSRSLEVSDEFK